MMRVLLLGNTTYKDYVSTKIDMRAEDIRIAQAAGVEIRAINTFLG